MAFFDNLSKTLAKTGQGAVQKTKEVGDIARITREIDRLEGSLSVLYSKIGLNYYKLHGTDAEPELADLVGEVTTARQQISDYKEQIKQIRGIVPCPNCGAEVPNNVPFCSACGFRMPQKNVTICSNCGAPMPKGTLFCAQCGAKAGDSTQPHSEGVPARRLCSNCGAVLAPGTLFCASCGTRADAVTEPEPVEEPPKASLCPVCGSEVPEGDVFCANCGNRLR